MRLPDLGAVTKGGLTGAKFAALPGTELEIPEGLGADPNARADTAVGLIEVDNEGGSPI